MEDIEQSKSTFDLNKHVFLACICIFAAAAGIQYAPYACLFCAVVGGINIGVILQHFTQQAQIENAAGRNQEE